MKINVSGHHVDISDSIRSDIKEKFEKVEVHFPRLLGVDVIISKDHGEYQVEMRTNYEGARISVSGKNEVMYPAINSAIKKLDSALKHKKGQLKADLYEKPVCTTPEIAHEKVQEMNLI